MFTLHTALTTIVLFAIVLAVIFFALKYFAKAAATARAQYLDDMEAMLRDNKDTAFKLNAMGGRLRGRIKGWKVHHINLVDLKTMKPIRTFYTLRQLFDNFECDPSEVRELKEQEEILENLRRFRDEEMDEDARPVILGYKEVPVIKHGTVNHYVLGDHNVLGTNRVVITISQRSNKTMYVSAIHMSRDIREFPPTSLDVSTAELKAFFKAEYLKDEAVMSEFYNEFRRVQQIETDLIEFNKHVNIFDFDADGNIVSYQPKPKKSKVGTERFQNLPNS